MHPTSETIAANNSVLIEASFGELADKIAILQIKSVRIADSAKLVNVREELQSLAASFENAVQPIVGTSSKRNELDQLVAQLKIVNETLWQVEDEIRDCERAKDFGPRFIELARTVYRQNDHRAVLKRQINDLLGSRIVEEKSYQNYDSEPGQCPGQVNQDSK